MSQCMVKGCAKPANYKIEYDCGDTDDQTIEICKTEYERYDELPSGEKFYYFKKFAKNVEVLK